MDRDTFARRAGEILASLADETDHAVRRAVWLRVLELADRHGFTPSLRGATGGRPSRRTVRSTSDG
ncbi:hypothetical protein FZ983_20355 [Azospirillum sp. B21]|uniref:hypothetical protein n=1 Tax=Azospirillum sp. B21 TaxID=2607496 RepID=UPI0011EC5C82|nr:hypothetical protein [Azospirillum sp. B21]KAA0577932.1 hypothetical protein FZ983_20355 [Azospirillum sp. B21]